MTRTSGRIKKVTNPAEILNKAKFVVAKHQELDAASPLNVSPDIHWNEVGPKVDLALQKHNQAEEYRAKMEEAYRERDILMPEIEENLKNTKIFLKGLHAKNPKRMTEWGFEVDDSVKRTPKPKENA